MNRKSKARFVKLLPRPLLVLAAEVAGTCAAYDGSPLAETTGGLRWKWFLRIRALLQKDSHFSCFLFDARYYLDHNPDVRESAWPPLLHFLLCGGFEGRKPHPLFDPDWYLAEYPDVATCGLNPLQHYVHFGWREGRNPHPLFDTTWYLHTYPDVKAAGCHPLQHFLEWGGGEGRQPHPLFDNAWYVRRYPAVKDSGLNPLVHYLLHGGSEGLKPNRNFNAAFYLEQYPECGAKGLNPLTHYVTSFDRDTYDPHPGYPRPRRMRTEIRAHSEGALTLTAVRTDKKPRQPWQNTFSDSALPIFLVYGRSNVDFIESELIPALAAQSCRTKLHLHTVHYKGSGVLLSGSSLEFSQGSLEGVWDWSAEREDRHIGFGEAVNYLFSRVAPESCFLLVNPDSMPMPGCIDRLLETFRERSAALVEARQWPSEHPKEYDASTGWTPWASGAFVLISSRAFRQLDGFDPLFFLYNEDVDLSWRAWLQGMPVVYEPRALCAHFTGLLSYRPSRFYYEQFFSIRNFLVIAYKFFGDAGEHAAWRWIDEARLPAAFRARVEESYMNLRSQIRRVEVEDALHADKVKVLGLNLYHQLRQL